jgi:hypothetical protein
VVGGGCESARSRIIKKGAWTGVCAVGNMLGYIYIYTTTRLRVGIMIPYYSILYISGVDYLYSVYIHLWN